MIKESKLLNVEEACFGIAVDHGFGKGKKIEIQ
jgi:hypothetical protein